MRVSIERISPEIAAQWLEKNTKNRGLSEMVVARYARDMKAGNWHWTGAPICWNGTRLLDGQHRLWAVITSGVTLDMAVAWDVAEGSQLAIDTGKPRNTADYLRWRGEQNAAVLAATLAAIWRFDNDGFAEWKTPSASELIALLDAHPEEIRASATMGSTTASAVRMPASTPGALHYLFGREASPEESHSFWLLVRSENTPPYSGPGLLRRFAVRAYMRKTVRPIQVEWMALSIKAFNMWMEGREGQNLMWRRGGSQPEAFPAIAKTAAIGDEPE